MPDYPPDRPGGAEAINMLKSHGWIPNRRISGKAPFAYLVNLQILHHLRRLTECLPERRNGSRVPLGHIHMHPEMRKQQPLHPCPPDHPGDLRRTRRQRLPLWMGPLAVQTVAPVQQNAFRLNGTSLT